jgi:hypothetical protein
VEFGSAEVDSVGHIARMEDGLVSLEGSAPSHCKEPAYVGGWQSLEDAELHAPEGSPLDEKSASRAFPPSASPPTPCARPRSWDRSPA